MPIENYPLNVRATLAQNPDAFLTNRGVAIKHASGYEELLISIPDLHKQSYYLEDHPELAAPAPLLLEQVGAVTGETTPEEIVQAIIAESTVPELIATTETPETDKEDGEPDAEDKGQAPDEDQKDAPPAPETKEEDKPANDAPPAAPVVEHKKPGRKPKVVTVTE